MFWILRKIVTLAIFGGLIWIILQLDYQGRPVRERVQEFFKAPLVQEVFRQGSGVVKGYLKKDLQSGPAMEDLNEEEREGLEKVLEKQMQ